MTVGLDSNIVCYLLDPAFPEHERLASFVESLSPQSTAAVNPTVLHESYHVLVYDRRLFRQDARTRLRTLLRHPFVEFFNQTKATSILAMNLAERYELGGRDSLMMANFLANHAREVYTHDSGLSTIGEMEWKGLRMMVSDPILRSRHE
jgi:predicted nucleic acid-binding protein